MGQNGGLPLTLTVALKTGQQSAVPCCLRSKAPDKIRTQRYTEHHTKQTNTLKRTTYCSEGCKFKINLAEMNRGPIFEKSHDELTKNLRKSLTYEKLRMSM